MMSFCFSGVPVRVSERPTTTVQEHCGRNRAGVHCGNDVWAPDLWLSTSCREYVL